MKNFILSNWKPVLSGAGMGLPVGVMLAQGRTGELILAGWGFVSSIFKLAAALL